MLPGTDAIALMRARLRDDVIGKLAAARLAAPARTASETRVAPMPSVSASRERLASVGIVVESVAWPAGRCRWVSAGPDTSSPCHSSVGSPWSRRSAGSCLHRRNATGPGLVLARPPRALLGLGMLAFCALLAEAAIPLNGQGVVVVKRVGPSPSESSGS
jgi:hypothetical protein